MAKGRGWEGDWEGGLLLPPTQPAFPTLPPSDCVVLANPPEATETSHLLQLRVQGKEKHQMLEVSLSPVSGKHGFLCPPPPLLSPISLRGS